MANEIPQLNDTQPILTPRNVESQAEGYNEFAKTLGSLASTTEQKSEEIEKDQSQAMLMQSSAQAETLKTNAQLEMIKHPDQTQAILDQTSKSIDALNQNAFVNDKDRKKLSFLNSQDFNELRTKATTVNFEQSQKSGAISFWDSYPVSMKQIQDALDTGDMKRAKILEDNLHATSLNAAKIGLITPEQFATIHKSNFDLYARTTDLIKMTQNPDGHNAATYHAAKASPFDTGNFGNVNYPTDTNTHWMANHYNSDRSIDGQLVSLYNDTPINWGVVAQGTDEQYNNFKMNMTGVHAIKGAIQSNTPYSQIDSHIKTLEAQPKLSPMEEGQVNYWKSFKNRLEKDNGYTQMMSQTTLGGRYTQDYNNESVAIMNSSKSPEDKFDAIRDNDNKYIGNMVSLGQSSHVDQNYIRPIPAPYVTEVQNAFIKDAPVTQALQRIAYIKPEFRPYLANAMTKPNQGMAVYLSGETMGKADIAFQRDLIEANQNRDYSSLLKTGKNETKNQNIWDDISNNSSMKDIYAYLGKLPGGNDAQNGFKDASTNYVLYRAAKEGDVNLNGKNTYENDFINNTAKGFNIVNGTRYLFNASTLNIRQADMDYIADYALSIAYKNIHTGQSEEQFQSYVDLNPLHATNTPDGRIVVIDKAGHAATDLQGNAAFDQPYTTNMLAASHKNATETIKYLHQYYGIVENAERQVRLHPGFPFVNTNLKSQMEGE